MEFNQVSIVFLGAALLCFILCYLAWQRHLVVAALEMCLLMIAVGFWTFFVFCEAASINVEDKLLWSKISYFFISITPVFYILFIYRFVENKCFTKIHHVIFLFIIPAITITFVWTNNSHHLLWTGFSSMTKQDYLINFQRGIWFWVSQLYSLALLLAATVKLLLFLCGKRHGLWQKGIWVMLSGLFPWITSIVYLLGFKQLFGVDITSMGVISSVILFMIGFYYTGYYNMIPVARETLVETLPDGILALDNLNRVQDINDRAKIILGIAIKQKTGIDIRELSVPYKTLSDAILSYEKQVMVQIGDEPDIKTYRIIKQVIRESPGSRVIIIRDISEQIAYQVKIKATEKKYREMYNMFRLISDNMSDMLWAKDLGKKYTFVNKAICNDLLKAKDTEEPIGKDFSYFHERECKKMPDNPLWHTYGEQGDLSDDLIISTHTSGHFDEHVLVDGVVYDLDVRKAPIFNENGEMIGVVGSARDVTLQKQTENELVSAKIKAEESDRLKSAFLANMSHEIRTPMNTILGFISILQEKDLEEKERSEYLNIVKESGERLLNTINDIIDISKIEAGQTDVTLSDFDLNELILNMFMSFKKIADDRSLLFIRKYSIPPAYMYVHSDKEKIYSIFTNLINNAFKYTKQGYVELSCTLTDTRLDISVKDTGIGIPADKREAIFERFIQVDLSHQRSFEGSGLGLSITKAYVELLKGSIWLESEVGKGSIFHVSLPIEQADFFKHDA